MKPLLPFLSLCLLSAGLRAAAPHPTVLTVEYNKAMRPVVRVIGTDPVVVVDGKEKRIRTEPAYLPQRAESFDDGFVQLSSVSLGGMELKVVASQEDANAMPATTGPLHGTSYFEATMKSKVPLQGGFAAVVIFPLSTTSFLLPSRFNQTNIIVHDLPSLPAGAEVKVKFTAALPDEIANRHYFVQIFNANGREVLTNAVSNAWQYYSVFERIKLADAVERYRQMFAGGNGNHAASPVMMTRPLLPEGVARPAELVPVRLTISAEGLVTDIDLTGVGEQRLHACIREALGGWLFLPRLKAGEPVPCKVEAPIQF